jgi:hypothetical protein
MGEAIDDELGDAEKQENPVRKRQRSPLAFPYSDLQRAIDLCDKLASIGGKGPVELTQLAAALNQTADGGTFRGRIGAARMFGLIEYGGDTAQLADLGEDILDPHKAQAAKSDAFLRVPLYAKLYEEYQGYALPQAAAIQRKMELLGLPKKQVERARQVFAASVETAGFINNHGRFVKPVVSARADPNGPGADAGKAAPPDDREPAEKSGRGGDGGSGGMDHPLIKGLLVTLPRPGGPWGAEGRKAWLKMAASIFDMIYKKGETEATADNQEEIDVDKLIGGDENGD